MSATEGSFCWIELASSNLQVAKQFYSKLFGWQSVEVAMGGGEVCLHFQLDGQDVAGSHGLRTGENAQSCWNLYVAVADAGAVAAKAANSGARLVTGPNDVINSEGQTLGRMAVIQDPTGAVCRVWQAGAHQGFGVTGQQGVFCWADLSTPDTAQSSKFYSTLFPWKLERSENDASGYLHIQNKGEYIGGVPPVAHRPASVPAHWLVYFAVASCDNSAAVAEAQGARLILPPMTVPKVGRMSIMADPQGAVFAIFEEAVIPAR